MDWDKDGNLDILSGCYWSDGADAAHLELLPGLGQMTFGTASPLLNATGKPLINVPTAPPRNGSGDVEWRNICTAQHAVDYDADGDLDLVVGCIGSELFLIENSGGDGAPLFADPPQQLPLSVPGGHGGPHLVDWDADGDLDLLTGSGNGGAYLAENSGTRDEPVWNDFQQLVPPNNVWEMTTDDGQQVVPARATRVWAYDFNGDGLLDLLLGDCVTIANRKPGLTAADHERMKTQYEQQLQAKQSELMPISQQYSEESSEGEVSDETMQKMQAMSKAYSEVYAKRNEFQDEQATGFIWLLIRKTPDQPKVTLK